MAMIAKGNFKFPFLCLDSFYRETNENKNGNDTSKGYLSFINKIPQINSHSIFLFLKISLLC